jgi:hypothetical protein
MGSNRRIWAALVHHPVLDRQGGVVTTSVTNMDIHDLARTGRTFDLAAVIIATPIDIHREMVMKVVSHWQDPDTWKRTPSRKEALELIRVAPDIGEAAGMIEKETGRKPGIVGTTARIVEGAVSFDDLRSRIRSDPDRPWLIIFGTGWGLAPAALEQCGSILKPIEGAGGYSHLSVRSAAAIILDRLLSDR